MNTTPNANRVHIAIFGRRNAGKSSLINAISEQEVALVSDEPGTTTDPVSKAMEIPGIGAVVFIDTAGFDDEGNLGNKRVERTEKVVDKTDIAILVVDADLPEGYHQEKQWLHKLKAKNIPVIGVLSRIDLLKGDDEKLAQKKTACEDALDIPFTPISLQDKTSIIRLRELMIEYVPVTERECFVADYVEKDDLVVLVMPQDKAAPKGRLILPQSHAIRDILEKGAIGVATTPETLKATLNTLSKEPDLVITDSQVFEQVKQMISDKVTLTSFSVLMAQYKGDATILAQGARRIESLEDEDKILIAEACTHHAVEDDIGRVKIPNKLKAHTGKNLTIEIASGAKLPENLSTYKLVIHCGACMFNRKQMMSNIKACEAAGVGITNYGMVLAHMTGILERTMEIFNRNPR